MSIFALRMLMGKYREGPSELHCVFVNLEEAYDRVLREELWYCLRASGVAESYVKVIQYMYEGSITSMRSAVGMTVFQGRGGIAPGVSSEPLRVCSSDGQNDRTDKTRTTIEHDVC